MTCNSLALLAKTVLNIARVLCMLRACQVISGPITTSPTLDDSDILLDLLHHSIDCQTLPNVSNDECADTLSITASIMMCNAMYYSSSTEGHDLMAQLPMFANSDDQLIDRWTSNITQNAAFITRESLEFSRVYHKFTHIIHYFAFARYSAMSRDAAINAIVTEYMPPTHRRDIKASRDLFMQLLKQFAKSAPRDSLFQHIANAHHLLAVMNNDLRICKLIIEKMQDKIARDFAKTCA